MSSQWIPQGTVSRVEHKHWNNARGAGNYTKFSIEFANPRGIKQYFNCTYWNKATDIKDGAWVKLNSYCPINNKYTDASGIVRYFYNLEVYEYETIVTDEMEKLKADATKEYLAEVEKLKQQKEMQQELEKRVIEFDIEEKVAELEEEFEKGNEPIPSLEAIIQANENAPKPDPNETKNPYGDDFEY